MLRRVASASHSDEGQASGSLAPRGPTKRQSNILDFSRSQSSILDSFSSGSFTTPKSNVLTVILPVPRRVRRSHQPQQMNWQYNERYLGKNPKLSFGYAVLRLIGHLIGSAVVFFTMLLLEWGLGFAFHF